MFYYSKSTRGFYHSDIHEAMPTDVVSVSDEQHAFLLKGQNEGLDIESDSNGNPILLDHRPTKLEMEIMKVRFNRDALLISTVDSMNPIRWSSMSATQQQAFTEYRQKLLDIPQQPNFPFDIVWPELPK